MSLARKIAEHAAQPFWRPGVAECAAWLTREGLTEETVSCRRYAEAWMHDTRQSLLGLPAHRAERLPRRDLEALREARNSQPRPALDIEAIWAALKDPRRAVLDLAPERMPADAFAFYRPFHFEPVEEWGIYLLAQPLLWWCDTLHRTYPNQLAAFNREVLLGCLTFEVFNHEFFHHLVECAATTLEAASAAHGKPRRLYLDYFNRETDHPDHPLEEALANAYAYSPFSFLTRVQLGVKVAWVRLYQELLWKLWPQEPAGYRAAGAYVDGGHVSGGAQLLGMLLGEQAMLDPASLLLLAQTVMPNGNSAFRQKPDIPTWLVGEPEVLKRFHTLVPALNATLRACFGWVIRAWSTHPSGSAELRKERANPQGRPFQQRSTMPVQGGEMSAG